MKQTLTFNTNGFKSSEDSSNLIIEGYAAHFNVPNKNGEIVDANSFKYWLSELDKGEQTPVMNFNHNKDQIIGRWDMLSCDNTGLYAIGHINTDVAFCRDTIVPLVNNGDLNSLSTEGFSDMSENELRDGAVYIKNFFLTAIAIVGLPADFFAKFEIRNGLIVPKSKILYYM